jgi:hypothetical protein
VIAQLLWIIPLAIWFGTIWHLVRTRSLAKSALSQILWALFVVLMPEFGVLLYWLIEARRRRYLPPAALAG